MENILAQSWFHIFCVPILFVLIGAVATSLGRRDGDSSPRKNDWAVGTITLLMTLGTIASDLYTYRKDTEKVSDSLGWLIVILLPVLLSIKNDRFTSWEKDSSGSPTNSKHIIWGIILPNLIAVFFFALYRYSTGK